MLLRILKWAYIASCVLLVGLLAWMTRKPLCIESKVISKIDILRNGSQETIYRCGYNKEVKYNPFVWSQLPRINRAIFRIERYDLWFKENLNHFYIYLDFDNPKVFVNTDHALRLGLDLFHNDVWLDRAFLKGLMGHRFSAPPTVEDRMSLELLIDLLLYLRGRPVVASHWTARDEELERWPLSLKSISGYCRSPWVFLEHLNFCSQEKMATLNVANKATDLSLHALFSQTLKEALIELHVNERLLLFQRISASLDQIEVKWKSASSLPSKEELDFASIKSRFQLLAENFQVMDQFLQNWQSALSRRGYHDKSKKELRFDVVLDVSSFSEVNDQFLSELRQVARDSVQRNFAVKQKNWLWSLPRTEPLEINDLKEIKSELLVMTRCHLPSFKEARDFSEVTNRLMVVQDCSTNPKIRFRRLLIQGIDGFAEENRELSFVAFHLPSLLAPKADNQLDELEFRFDKQSDRPNIVENAYGWRRLVEQPYTGSYKVLSDVDAVTAFRPPPGLVLRLDLPSVKN